MGALQPDDRRLIQQAAERFVADHFGLDQRAHATARVRHWATFAELGWIALPFAEESGGIGGGIEDVQLLARSFGHGLVDEPYLEAVVAGKVLERAGSALLDDVIAGLSIVVLAHGEESVDPGFDAVRCRAEAAADGFVLSGIKRVVPQAGDAGHLLVTALLGQEPAVFLVERGAAGVRISDFSTIDSRRAADIELAGARVPQDALVVRGAVAVDAVRDAQLYGIALIAGEARGIADTLVVMTAQYLETRVQFGAKLASFQALQHRLADMMIGCEEIRSLEWLAAGAWEIEDPSERERVLRSAKARIGRVLRAIGESAVQLHGGMGVSSELVIGHYLRRAIALDALFGDATQQLGWLAERY
jgi:alkylation response protein AidB-like acyl-CoA dehydrogenase